MFWILLFWMSLTESPELQALRSQIEALTKDQQATFGIAFEDLSSHDQLFINADDRMHAASTMKTPVMMRLFQMVDHGPNLSLHTKIEVRNRFASIVDGSPYEITVDSEEELYQKLGSEVRVIDLIEAMITKSSNLATNLLIELADPEETTRFMHQLGAEDILVLRGVEDLKAYEQGRNNESSARAMLRVMVACADSTAFSRTSRRHMLQILRRQHYNHIIPAGIPESAGARVAHKTGSISTVQHDAAIVELRHGRRYGLVIFARDFGDEGGREKVIATGRQISRLVYDFVAGKTDP